MNSLVLSKRSKKLPLRSLLHHVGLPNLFIFLIGVSFAGFCHCRVCCGVTIVATAGVESIGTTSAVIAAAKVKEFIAEVRSLIDITKRA